MEKEINNDFDEIFDDSLFEIVEFSEVESEKVELDNYSYWKSTFRKRKGGTLNGKRN